MSDQRKYYRQKMLEHLQKAQEKERALAKTEEYYESVVRRTKAFELRKITDPLEHRRMMTMWLADECRKDPWYTIDGNVRRYHTEMATMYGLAALVEDAQ
jgi:hypothetical protein